MKCPHCRGTGSNVVYACPGWIETTVECRDCQGTGNLTEARQQELASAEKLRQYRMSLDVSGREFAKAHGFGVVEYSHMEHGQAPIAPELLALLAPGPQGQDAPLGEG